MLWSDVGSFQSSFSPDTRNLNNVCIGTHLHVYVINEEMYTVFVMMIMLVVKN